MGQYVISYDLHQSGRDYERVRRGIEALSDYVKILESVWLVSHAYSAVQIRDHMRAFMDDNDSVMVLEIGVNWATWGCSPAANAWLSKHRP
jgi:hypothetical protein